MSFQWQTALTTESLGAYTQTIGSGWYYLRKNQRNDGTKEHFKPMVVRLLSTNLSETVVVKYTA
jgi:hypothetical protein